MNKTKALLALTPFLFGLLSVAEAATPDTLRNYPYCEVIPLVVEGGTSSQIVFNTLGLNTCPRSIWKTITEADVIAAYNASYNANVTSANLNGRRHWLMDQIVADGGDTVTGNKLTVNGLEFEQRGVLSGSEETGSAPYVAGTISRATTYIYKKGLPTFQLTDSCGTVYTMQSYSQQVDPRLTYNKLKTLGKTLKRPVGWRYKVVRPKTTLELVAAGSITVIQDSLANTYQINSGASHTRPDCIPTN